MAKKIVCVKRVIQTALIAMTLTVTIAAEAETETTMIKAYYLEALKTDLAATEAERIAKGTAEVTEVMVALAHRMEKDVSNSENITRWKKLMKKVIKETKGLKNATGVVMEASKKIAKETEEISVETRAKAKLVAKAVYAVANEVGTLKEK